MKWILEEDETMAFQNYVDSLSAIATGDETYIDIRNLRSILLERYAILVLYYATGGHTSWFGSLNFLNKTASICEWNDLVEFDGGVLCDDQGSANALAICKFI